MIFKQKFTTLHAHVCQLSYIQKWIKESPHHQNSKKWQLWHEHFHVVKVWVTLLLFSSSINLSVIFQLVIIKIKTAPKPEKYQIHSEIEKSSKSTQLRSSSSRIFVFVGYHMT